MAVDPRVLKTIQDETFTAANPLPTARAIAPDAAGRAVKAHRKTGVDDLLYAENLPQLNDIDDQEKWDRIVAESPRTARFLAEKQTHAAMGSDDADNLQKIEKDFNRAMAGGWAAKGVIGGTPFQRSASGAVSGRIGTAYKAPDSEALPFEGVNPTISNMLRGIGVSFVEGGIQTKAGMQEQFTDVLGDSDVLGLIQQREEARKAFGLQSERYGLQGILQDQRASAQSRARLDYATPVFETDTAKGLYSGLQSTAQQIPGIAATLITRMPLVGLASAGIQAETAAYSKYRARGATVGEAFLGGGLEGGIEVVTEKIPLGTLLSSFGKGGKDAALGIIKSQVQEQFGEQVATVLQDAVDTAIANPNKTWGEYLAERPSAAYQTALATLAQSGVMYGAHATAARVLAPYQQKANQAVGDAAFLESIDKLSQASKVRSLDTTTFENFIADISSGTPAENIYIDGNVLNQSSIALPLAQAVPELAADIELAIQSGGTLKIPTATYAGRIAGTEFSQTILENARTDPAGFSKIEAQEFYDNQAEIVRAEIERAADTKILDDEFTAGQKRVQANIKAQLDAVGKFTPEANDLYALLIGSRVATRARQLGISPEEMLEQSPLRVVDRMPVSGEVLNQGAILDDVRKQWADAGIEGFIGENDKSISLSKIIVPVGEQGKGKGTSAIQSLIDYADRSGKRITLTPSSDFGGNKKRLTEFYKRFGFVENKGRNKDYSTMEGMYRDPKDQNILNQSEQLPDTITIDGKERSTTNSNGQLIAQTEDGVRNFWRWFGDSKVVDENGRPRVVYHGTNKKFTKIDLKKGAQGLFWFTSDRAAIEAGEVGAAGSGTIMELYAKVENPANWNQYDQLMLDEFKSRGLDGAILPESDREFVGFIIEKPTQIKSATGNRGVFDPFDANILNQDQTEPRGQFNASANIIALLEKADLSTFLHEAAHWFYETDIAMASKFVQQETRTAGEQEIVDDVSTLLNWHGITGTPQQQLDQWHAMDMEAQRAMHERTAESFESYLYTGKAPTLEMQKAFSTFRQWLISVYRSAKEFLASRNRELPDEIRGVFDRMIATQEQIEIANSARSMVNLIDAADQVGMSEDEFVAYQKLGADATDAAVSELEARTMRDMQFTHNARSNEIKRLKAEQKEARSEIEMTIRREVMSMPIYRAWSFLTGRIREEDQILKEEKSPRDQVDPKKDSLFVAIAKLGGLNRADVESTWGVTDKIAAPVFGKPLLRKTAGRTLYDMTRALGEFGYITQDRNGKTDIAELEEKFIAELKTAPQYSVLYVTPEEVRPSDDMGGGRFGEGELLSMGLDPVEVRMAQERKMVSKNGFHPDFIAEMFGFDSGSQLISELADADSPKLLIEKLVDARMMMNYGDLATDEAIEEAADKAIMNKVRARHVITEHNALAKATGGVRILEKAAAELADQIIAAKKVRDINPREYTAAAAKAARSAKKAMREGNLRQAAEDSRARVIQTVTAKAAYDAKEEIETIDKYFKSILVGSSDKLSRSRDMSYVNAARAMIAEIGYGRKGQDPNAYLDILKKQDPVTYDAVVGSVVAIRAMQVNDIKDLTLDQLRQVHEEAKALWHMSKRSHQLEVDGKLMDREDAENAIIARMEERGPITSDIGMAQAISEKEVRALHMGSLKGILTRVENWVGYMDGNDKFGAFRRYFYQPVKDAADQYRAARIATLKSFRSLFDQIAPTMKAEKIEATEIGYTFGNDSGGVGMNELLHAILHTGNDSNKRKLLLGRDVNGKTWADELPDGTLDTSRWDAFIARMIREGKLTKEHFDFVQGVWDLLESQKDKAQEAHRDAYGKYFDEVTANEFTTPFGTYRGGYVPAKIDSRIVTDNELRNLIDAGKEGMAYAFPSTTKGFTKSRTEYNRPLLLDLRLLSQHLDSVLLFSYMENPVRDAAKIMSRGKVHSALSVQQPGMVTGAIIPFLNRAAKQQVTTPVVGAAPIMRLLNQIRARTGMAAMFANFSNSAQQITGFALAATKVKPSLMVSAAADYLSRPTKVGEEVAEMSVYMKNRMSNEVSAMMGEIDQILLNPSLYEKTQEWFQRHGYFMQSAVDNVMGPIIWKAAFQQYQEEGFNEADSIRLADGVIRTTQGSTLAEDVSRIETGPAYARLFTQFAGYFNMQANLLGEEFGKVAQNGGLRKNMGRGFYITMVAFLAPAVAAEAISQFFRGGPGDEDKDGEYLDDWMMSTLVYGPMRNAVAFVPFVGQVVNSAIARFNGNPTDDKVSVAPVVGAIEGAAGVPYDLYKEASDKGNSNRTIKDVSTLISLTTGIPLTAAVKPVRYLVGVEEGKIVPEGAGDYARGLMTGVASPESKRQ